MSLEYIKKIANETNQSLGDGTHELTQAADILATVPERYRRMRAIAAEVGILVVGAADDLDKAGISIRTCGELLVEVLEVLKGVESTPHSPLSAKANEVDAALKETSGKLDYHEPFIRRSFDEVFFAETEAFFQGLEERTTMSTDIIKEANEQQTAAITACRQSLEDL